MTQPKLGLTDNVNIISVYDGDTVTASIQIIFTARITDEAGTYNTSEIRTNDPKEKEKGIEARDKLISLLFKEYDPETGKGIQKDNIVAFLPFKGDDKVSGLFAIGSRPVIRLYVDGEEVTDLMKEYNITMSNYKRRKLQE